MSIRTIVSEEIRRRLIGAWPVRRTGARAWLAAPALASPRAPVRPGSRWSGRHLLPGHGPQGLLWDGAQHHVEGVVHGGRRRAVRRVQPDDREHQRQHRPVHRHRRTHVRRPAAAGHDVLGQLAGSQRHGLPGDEHRPRSPLPPGQRLHHRSGARQRRHPHDAGADGRRRALGPEPQGLRPLRRDHRQHGRRRRGQRRAQQRHHRSGDDGPGLLRHHRSDRSVLGAGRRRAHGQSPLPGGVQRVRR